jgi:hypothetical protein
MVVAFCRPEKLRRVSLTVARPGWFRVTDPKARNRSAAEGAAPMKNEALSRVSRSMLSFASRCVRPAERATEVGIGVLEKACTWASVSQPIRPPWNSMEPPTSASRNGRRRRSIRPIRPETARGSKNRPWRIRL